MKIIIAGAGEVGRHLAKMLSKENQDVTLIDQDQTRLDVIDATYNLMTWNGNTYSFSSLKDVGVSDTDLFIAVTPFETNNITSCAIAKSLGASKTVARIDNSEFLIARNGTILRDLGVDYLIYPENVAANEIAISLNHNWARYWGELHDGKLLLIGVKLHDQNLPILNCKIKDLPVTTHDFHIAAIKRRNETIIPNGDTEILPDDIVYFITTPPFIQDVRELCGKTKRVIKKVLIMGGSRIARRFCSLYQDKFHIKIIDKDMDKCERLATNFPNCEVVFGDGRDIEVLRENNIFQYDAFLAMTESSETNILACMTAKEFDVRKTVADVENLQFVSLAENLNIGTTINKKLLASGHIFKILLDTDQTNSRFLALADADVAEIQAHEGSKITKAPVRDLKLPYGMTLAGLIRGDEVRLIDGNTRIMPDDYVVLFTLQGTLEKIEKWFS